MEPLIQEVLYIFIYAITNSKDLQKGSLNENITHFWNISEAVLQYELHSNLSSQEPERTIVSEHRSH